MKIVRLMDQIYIFKIITGYFKIFTLERMQKMENGVFIGSFGHFDSEEATTGWHHLKEIFAKVKLLYSAIHVSDCVTEALFDDVYCCSHSLPDVIRRATGVMIDGKRALVFGYGDADKAALAPCAPSAAAY